MSFWFLYLVDLALHLKMAGRAVGVWRVVWRHGSLGRAARRAPVRAAPGLAARRVDEYMRRRRPPPSYIT